ncbi:redoxin domain-containing protein [Fredinandcohnia sp. 179-A 10B2 NHS]|uniref:redoxin domain-containing protein n=1 Tax=Fredinandcohnia sp. 179-A 10B2 NHS TaxID=3235176 RepID=UPI0039A235A6
MPVFQIGSLAIMVKWLILGIALLVGMLISRFWLLGTQEKEIGKKAFGQLTNSIFIGFLAWKGSLLLLDPVLVLKNPLSLLYFTGGTKGIFIAIIIMVFYTIYQLKKQVIQPRLLIHSTLLLILGTQVAYFVLALLLLNQHDIFYFVTSICTFLLLLVTLLIKDLQKVEFKKEVLSVNKKVAVITALFGLIVWTLYTNFSTEGMSSPMETEQFREVDLEVGISEGQLAPDFILQTIEGEELQLSSLRGKKIILNFWATWCPPCKAEMPHMQRFYEEQNVNNIEVIAVNLTTAEKSTKDIAPFVEDYGLTFPILLDETGDIGNTYQAYTIPTSYVIDSYGIIQKKIVGPMDKEMMEELIKNIK